MSWQPISERIISARFKNRTRNLTSVQCYAPTEVADATCKDAFYEQLSTAQASIDRRDVKILIGDLNAQVGQIFSECTGTHVLRTTTNENGRRLVDLCTDESLIIGGTLYPHKDIHKYTWTSPDGRTRNQIDHICISKEWRSSLLNVKNRRGAVLDTDHQLVFAESRIKLAKIPRKGGPVRRHLNIEKFADARTRECIKEELRMETNGDDPESLRVESGFRSPGKDKATLGQNMGPNRREERPEDPDAVLLGRES